MSDIVIAPFSNSDIRDWPVTHNAVLVGLLLEGLDPAARIRVIGTANQKLRGCEIVRYHPVDRVVNDCGRFSWPEVIALLRGARCIISNNSGVGHLGGAFGVPTVCIFGGSHQRHEWRPLGASVMLVSRAIGCSPCQLDHGSLSPYDKACLREIAPETVAAAAFAIMEEMEAAPPSRGRTDDRLAHVR